MSDDAELALQPDTPARKKLIRWMREAPRERTQTSIARALGKKQASVRQWIVRIARPDPANRQALQAHTGGRVPAEEWETGKERRARETALKRVQRLAAASP